MSRAENLRKKSDLVYSRTETEKVPRRHPVLLAIFVLLVLSGFGWVLLFSGWFEIKNIEINGYSHSDTVRQIVGEEVTKNIFTKNILLFNTGSLKKTLSGDANIETLKISRKFPDTVVINITEAVPALIWVSAGESFVVDERGTIIKNYNNENLPAVHDASNIKVRAGERVASPTFIKFINDISSGFEASTATKLSRITIFDLLTDVHILSSDGWTVYLDATKSADAQLNNLSKVLAEARKSTKKLEYIDMRLDTKIFYK